MLRLWSPPPVIADVLVGLHGICQRLRGVAFTYAKLSPALVDQEHRVRDLADGDAADLYAVKDHGQHGETRQGPWRPKADDLPDRRGRELPVNRRAALERPSNPALVKAGLSLTRSRISRPGKEMNGATRYQCTEPFRWYSRLLSAKTNYDYSGRRFVVPFWPGR